MKKMPCLFEREFHGKGSFTLLKTITPGCEWVEEGLGVATRKWDGTAVMFDGARWYQRYDAKSGNPPLYCFIACEPERDPITGHWPGWTPVNMGNESAYIREAIQHYEAFIGDSGLCRERGTFEACGPKINSNPEKLAEHRLFKHGNSILDCPRDFEGIKQFLTETMIEGVVFHHPACGAHQFPMCKIRRADFALPWGKHGRN
jgi:hypothetical protein